MTEAASTAPMIRMVEVDKYFGQLHVLKNINIEVPRGQVVSYGYIAKRLRSAARAVGQACGANPFPPIVPCHRVVSASGLGGFANNTDGFLIATKRWLLTHEGWLSNSLI